MVLMLILLPLFVFFVFLFYIAVQLLQMKADRLLKQAEVDLDELFLQVQAKRVLHWTAVAVILPALLGLLLTRSPVIAVILGVCGSFMPRLFFSMQKAKRFDALNSQLVAAIEMMANALRSGSNLPQAIQLIQKEMGPPISQEFAMLTKEMAVGVPLEDALDHMNRRVGSEEFAIMVTATSIARETGGNLAEVYQRISKTIRDRKEMQGKIKALTAEGKLQGIFIGLLPFILGGLITIIDPEMMRPLYTTTWGYILIGIVIFMELMGAFFIKKIITINV
jgi:tight adherence protein B